MNVDTPRSSKVKFSKYSNFCHFGFQDELRLDEKITSGNDSLKPREGMKFMHIPHIHFIFSVY